MSSGDTGGDPYFGHARLAHACARFLTTELALASAPTDPPLAPFIAYAFVRTQYHTGVLLGGLLLLSRARPRPGARAHRLFAAGFLLSSKLLSDDVYALSGWHTILQATVGPAELAAAELALCVRLQWRLHFGLAELFEFEDRFRTAHAAPLLECPLQQGLVRRARVAKIARAVPCSLPPSRRTPPLTPPAEPPARLPAQHRPPQVIPPAARPPPHEADRIPGNRKRKHDDDTDDNSERPLNSPHVRARTAYAQDATTRVVQWLARCRA